MLMYEIFRSLGLEVSFRPVVNDLHFEDGEGEPAPPIVGVEMAREEWRGQTDNGEVMQQYSCWVGCRTNGYYRGRFSQRPPGDYLPFEEIHWLNDFGHMESQISWIAVSYLVTLSLLCLPAVIHVMLFLDCGNAGIADV